MARKIARKVAKSEIESAAADYLSTNSDVREIIELFGLTYDQYQIVLSAQQKPIFYNSNVTV